MGNRKATLRKNTPDQQTPDSSTSQPGLVIAHYGRDLVIEDQQGALHLCTARKKLGRLVCGDRVQWQPSGDKQGVVTARDPRRSLLARPDERGNERPLAANVDQLVVVCASEPPLSEGLIDRYLVVAELIGARPLLLVNKSDLLSPPAQANLQERLATFTQLDCPVLFTSTQDQAQVKALTQHFNGHTSILVGQSGVGKSSLVQLLHPNTDIRIGQLSDASGLGKHTTTETTLYHLAGGGDLIDSPGVRDFQLWQVTPDDLERGFSELNQYRGQCRFHNCRHNGEPGCAVSAAVQDGVIAMRRLDSYRELLKQALAREKDRYPP